ncbi:thiamine-phosphate kinase [Pseudomonas sp. OIL-1]|uniref:thiamine-phosphate kinase n=1 Tax=Pseudomonas sp. OIL-1 TaxID=2706126 RepID=UPI0013A73D34|nr:thiamine-phosphate kinase [Pseudomonas sp. OIL-1]QIB50745.1 thiamine-phosphate kinase [Pseudomonas sp. OIL-1]
MKREQTLGEFELIKRYFRGAALEAAGDQSAIALGIGDDAALLNIPSYRQLVISTDSLVQDTHFPSNCSPDDLGYRALAVAVSDLAAMAARPLAFTLALTLPDVEENWLNDFARGLAEAAQAFQISLIGGDTTRGPLNIGVTVFGDVPCGLGLQRSGAMPGDLLCVGGPLGDGAGGLAVVLGQDMPATLSIADRNYLYQRFWRPRAQCELGQALAGIASAGLDVSDGLLADAGHLASRSGVAVHIGADDLPHSPALGNWQASQRLQWMLGGGDDYVLLFSLPASHRASLDEWQARGWSVSVIGEIRAGEGVWLDEGTGPQRVGRPAGYNHFQGAE